MISFFTWPPEYEALCSHAAVIEHLRSTGRFVWIYQPDAYGLVADANKRLRQRFEAEERDAQARARREQERFDKAYNFRTPPAAGPAAPIQPVGPAWAAMKKKNASYFGYRLADGTVWVYFEIESGGIALRPLNLQGWKTNIPVTLGQYDANNDVVLCSAPPTFRSVVATRISSQFADIEVLASPDWDQVGFFGGNR